MTGPTICYRLARKDKHTDARLDGLITPHGTFPTPMFMSVGTLAAVKATLPKELEEMGAGVILSNIYHLWLRPGEDLVGGASDLHKFMNWDQPTLTDSDGFQVFSLNDMRRTREGGVHSRNYLNSSKTLLSPERAISIQNRLRSDIMMGFDECPPLDESYEYAKRSIERTSCWAECGLKAHANPDRQGSLDIVQDAGFEDLHRQSTKDLMSMDSPGCPIGDLSVSESKEEINRVLDFTAPLIPESKPRYLMGIGAPDSLIDGVIRRIGIFDCVLPTHIARSGICVTSQGHLVVENTQYARDFRPLGEKYDCYVCRNYMRAYIRHLIKCDKTFGIRLTSYRNLYFLLDLVKNVRRAIMDDNLLELRQAFFGEYGFNKANAKSL